MAGRRKRDDDTSQKRRWLDAEELQTWMALNALMTQLPTVLGEQLQQGFGLSFIEYYALAYLSDQPDRTLRMSQLALLTNAELSRMSHLVSRLEKRGLVRRRPDPADGRFTQVILTDGGEALLHHAAPQHVDHVRRLVFDVLDGTAQRAVRDAATAIVKLLDDPAEPSPST